MALGLRLLGSLRESKFAQIEEDDIWETMVAAAQAWSPYW
jgi:hypothetical protein